jgi:hypothetical protein
MMFDRTRCLHCKKMHCEHNAKTRACPMGSKHRTLGYNQFHPTNVFKANARSKPRENRGFSL